MTPGSMPTSRTVATEDLFKQSQPGSSELILNAALKCFSTRGYHATTTRDIARAAGMSPTALYIHYRSKEEVLYEIIRIAHESAVSMARSSVSREGGTQERVRALIHDFAAWHARHYTLVRVAQYELGGLSDEHLKEIKELRHQMELILREEVENGSKEGVFDVSDPRLATLAILSLGIDIARWFHPHTRLTPERLGEAYAEFGLRMLGTTQPGRARRHVATSPDGGRPNGG
jgi:AcrR family transcriptional regulator